MQSSRRRKKKFSQDLKHSHHRVRTSSSRAVTQLAPITFGKKIRQQLDVKQQAFPSEPKLKKRRLYVRDVYNKCTTRKKNIGKANICALKNKQLCVKKQAIFTQKRSPFPHRREQATQLFYQQHTQRQQQQ
jgi:hypothetical protein